MSEAKRSNKLREEHHGPNNEAEGEAALANSPAHHVNKHSPAVQCVWFGWYWGLGRSLMLAEYRRAAL